ncbi:MAG TPA: glycosyltransferase family 4 protein [Steroidobacteraceae bacterium]|jgi:glycosyltransferase involved in cell wall biosynthesis|nr:glycosyltransferase family 4 protein [Steroidobacteraceae bacterium]
MNSLALEFLVPGDLDAATGGYGYDRRIISGLLSLGWRVTVHQLDASFPQPTAAALEHAQTLLARLPERALVLVDGLAAGAMPQVLRTQAARLRLVALVHHPLAAESGLAAHRALELRNSEQLALQAMRHVIVTSEATKLALGFYGVDPDSISVVEPGTDAAALAYATHGSTLKMLCVAALIPRKGHDVLFDALARLPPRWTLICVGSLQRSAATVAQLRKQLQALGLERQVTLAGEVDAATLDAHYRQADLFVLATRFEGYGMAVAEALAHGLPVVSTNVDAIAERVGPDAGLLVAPDDAPALSAALSRILNEPALLDHLAAGAALIRNTLPQWPESCARMSRILELQHAPD